MGRILFTVRTVAGLAVFPVRMMAEFGYRPRKYHARKAINFRIQMNNPIRPKGVRTHAEILHALLDSDTIDQFVEKLGVAPNEWCNSHLRESLKIRHLEVECERLRVQRLQSEKNNYGYVIHAGKPSDTVILP